MIINIIEWWVILEYEFNNMGIEDFTDNEESVIEWLNKK